MSSEIEAPPSGGRVRTFALRNWVAIIPVGLRLRRRRRNRA
ncbi:MAG: hypothetical protein ACSLE6_01540 [Mycobacterium sp.]